MKKKKTWNDIFSSFSKMMSNLVGHSMAFAFAVIMIFVWLFSGPFFKFSDTWQLIINTSTTIVTFLIVFLLQHTQNRDTIAIHLKLDEMIRAMTNAHNELVKIEELSDDELRGLLKNYETLAADIRSKIQNGDDAIDIGSPEVVVNRKKKPKKNK